MNPPACGAGQNPCRLNYIAMNSGKKKKKRAPPPQPFPPNLTLPLNQFRLTDLYGHVVEQKRIDRDVPGFGEPCRCSRRAARTWGPTASMAYVPARSAPARVCRPTTAPPVPGAPE